jgi:hypothetical protein
MTYILWGAGVLCATFLVELMFPPKE